MKKQSSKKTAALALAIMSAAATTPALAQSVQPEPRIVVSGEGRADVAPDMALISMTVTRQAETARAALDANSAAMAEVIAAMKALGIEDRDLQTSNFSVQPDWVYPDPAKTKDGPKITGYTVRNGLSVRIRDIAKVGEVLDTSVSLGVNEGGNIAFTNDDPSAALTEARTKAVKDALSKAATLAEAAGVKVGKIIEINESASMPRPIPMMQAEMAMARSADAVPVATGENSYNVTVNVTFAIEQ